MCLVLCNDDSNLNVLNLFPHLLISIVKKQLDQPY